MIIAVLHICIFWIIVYAIFFYIAEKVSPGYYRRNWMPKDPEPTTARDREVLRKFMRDQGKI